MTAASTQRAPREDPGGRVSARGRLFVPASRVDAKLRYRTPSSPAHVEPLATGFRLRFEEPVYAAVPGQAAVLYEGDAVVGSGLIRSAT